MKNATPQVQAATVQREYRRASLTLERVHKSVIARAPQQPNKVSAGDSGAAR